MFLLFSPSLSISLSRRVFSHRHLRRCPPRLGCAAPRRPQVPPPHWRYHREPGGKQNKRVTSVESEFESTIRLMTPMHVRGSLRDNKLSRSNEQQQQTAIDSCGNTTDNDEHGPPYRHHHHHPQPQRLQPAPVATTKKDPACRIIPHPYSPKCLAVWLFVCVSLHVSLSGCLSIPLSMSSPHSHRRLRRRLPRRTAPAPRHRPHLPKKKHTKKKKNTQEVRGYSGVTYAGRPDRIHQAVYSSGYNSSGYSGVPWRITCLSSRRA